MLHFVSDNPSLLHFVEAPYTQKYKSKDAGQRKKVNFLTYVTTISSRKNKLPFLPRHINEIDPQFTKKTRQLFS